MGSVTYDFLADSLFLHPRSLESNFRYESNGRLEKELQAYREHCIKNYSELISEIKNKKSSMKVFSSTENITLELLTQTALYVEQFIIPDPLFKFTDTQSEVAKVTSKYLGYSEKQLDRERLESVAQFLKAITPMVAGDFVKLFPLSYHFEAPRVIPFNAPLNYNYELLPEGIREYFWDNAEVKSLIRSPKGGWVVDDRLYPCRGIIVDYKESTGKVGMIYHLFETRVLDLDEETGKVRIAQSLPDTPPKMDEFRAWVIQSVNSASKAYFDRIYFENCLAADLNATYLTDNSFTGKLITQKFDVSDSISTFTATQMMNIELPFITNIDIDKLMFLRQSDSDVFINFRLELEKQFRELRTITDEKTLRAKIDNVFHELNDVQGHRITTRMKRLKEQMGINVLLGMAGLGGAIHSAGVSLLATATAIGKGYKDYREFSENAKESPAYVLWKSQRTR